jgi:hypothetical protein
MVQVLPACSHWQSNNVVGEQASLSICAHTELEKQAAETRNRSLNCYIYLATWQMLEICRSLHQPKYTQFFKKVQLITPCESNTTTQMTLLMIHYSNQKSGIPRIYLICHQIIYVLCTCGTRKTHIWHLYGSWLHCKDFISSSLYMNQMEWVTKGSMPDKITMWHTNSGTHQKGSWERKKTIDQELLERSSIA